MFDTHSDYALNKLDKSAIVCPSVTGDAVRLTREAFSSDEEFEYWKAWSDGDYHEIELAGRNDDDCLSFEGQRDTPVASAEEMAFAPYIAAEQESQKRRLLESIRTRLTEKQYRRLCLYYLEGKTETEIATLEGITQQRISKSIIAGGKTVEKFFQDFLRSRG